MGLDAMGKQASCTTTKRNDIDPTMRASMLLVSDVFRYSANPFHPTRFPLLL
jgi:hypothetical protein